MLGDGLVVEDFGDGLGGESGLLGRLGDQTRDGFFAEGNKDGGAGWEFLIGFVGENVGAGAEDFSRGNLIVVHVSII